MIRINLGSGNDRLKDYINIDNRAETKPDLLCDITEGLPFDDNLIDNARAFDFLEHIRPSKTLFVIEEIWRVLKNGGIFEHHTPSTDGRGAYMDLSHISFWNINSWLYFCDDAWRGIYNYKPKFEIVELRDIITSNHLRIIHTYGLMYAIK